MANTDNGRIFTRRAGKDTLTRTVFTPADEVDALFDGYVEEKPAADEKKAVAPGSSASKSNTGA